MILSCFHRVSIRAGNHFNDLVEVEQVELSEPCGWVVIPLRSLPASATTTTEPKPVRAFMLQVAVLSNHQNGRDTHMRQIKVHAPVKDGVGNTGFTSVGMAQFAMIR